MPDTIWTLLEKSVDEAAPRLLGCRLLRVLNGQELELRITEIEAYDQNDPASHSFKGPSARNAVMFGPSGHLYVYLSYGVHYCCNVAAGPKGFGSGILIRAGEALKGIETMEKLRGMSGPNLSNGPGKVCQALAIDMRLSGHNLREGPLRLLEGFLKEGEEIMTSSRIGISKAKELQRRYFIKKTL